MKTISLQQQRVKLAVTLGDPAGIGPEVVLKALADLFLLEQCDVTVFGDRTSLIQTYRQVEATQGVAYVQQYLAHPDALKVVEPETCIGQLWTLGIPSAQTGAASFRDLKMAIAQTLAGD
jgi:4-hydroxythreonine-4-phosphate dehydrogenase